MATTNLRDTYGTIDMELKKYKLGELADFYGGVAYKPSDITNEGIRIIRGGNIQNGVILEKADDVFLPLSYANPENQIHIYDTIIVSSTGSIDALAKAATCFEEMPGTQIGAFLRIIRPKDKKNAMLISAWCTSQHFRDYMINCAKGTSINNIRTDFLENYELVVPSDENVRGLSSLYLNIERKLYLNRHINQNLEALAKQLYDYWFVQFDFPDENGKPYKSSGGAMVYNEQLKREIPQGWEYFTTDKLTNVITGKEDANFSVPNGVYPFFTCSRENLRCATPAFAGKAILIAGNGDFNVKHYNGTFNAYQRTYVLIPKDSKYYGVLYFAALERIDLFKAKSNGSIIKFITKGDVENIGVYDCHKPEIYKQINTLIEAIETNECEIASLIKQRNELLPLLMNGQVNFDLSAD